VAISGINSSAILTSLGRISNSLSQIFLVDFRPLTSDELSRAKRYADETIVNKSSLRGYASREWDIVLSHDPVISKTSVACLRYVHCLLHLLKDSAILCQSINVQSPTALRSYEILGEFLHDWEPASDHSPFS
jgi:hypothetical protein